MVPFALIVMDEFTREILLSYALTTPVEVDAFR